MNKISRRFWGGALVAALAVSGAIALGNGPTAPPIDRDAASLAILPNVRIISWSDPFNQRGGQESVARLDTRTGAIHVAHGNLTNRSSAITWQRRVPAVSGGHSGMLDIQTTPFGRNSEVFLVDNVTGKTWILRRDNNGNGRWSAIDEFQ